MVRVVGKGNFGDMYSALGIVTILKRNIIKNRGRYFSKHINDLSQFNLR